MDDSEATDTAESARAAQPGQVAGAAEPADVAELDAAEARVLGCLMEKAATTPDNYPLSLNALVAACNQSTNRDPVVHYDERTVEEALDGLREKGLARRIKQSGARVVKHRHVVDEALGLDAGERALLGVLLLRGPQTPGELKGRADRWHGFVSLGEVEGGLDALGARRLARRLERQPGQKETRWAQTLTPVSATGAYGDVGVGAEIASATAVAPVPQGPTAGPAAAAVPAVSVAPVVQHALEIRNPADGSLIRTVEADSEGDVERKVARGRDAQPGWAARPYAERAAAVAALVDLLEGDAEECARATTGEMGKPIRQSRGEIAAVRERVEWFLANVPAVTAAREVVGSPAGMVERVTYEPVGLVAHISAWNYPYFVGLNTIVPALLAGNAVLYKPSEYATLTGLRLGDLFHRAGVPIDVLQVVPGGGATGAALAAADTDLVCFTGSYATGAKVAVAAAARLARVQLELGGKDPVYVCDDVDVEAAAAATAEGVYYNTGQSCCAVERLYVHERVWEEFVAAFVQAARAGWKVGDPSDETTTVGPLARPAQVDLLVAQVDDAVAKGARLLLGGQRIDRPGNWSEPTVLVDVDHSMMVMRDESFGPLIGIQRVRGDDEATVLMGDTDYGLTAAVFTPDRARAERILASLDVGSAYWNCTDRTCVRLPWAGRRHSGLGVSLSESGVRAFLREKAWHLRP